MKATKFLLAMFIAAGMAACNTEDEPQFEQQGKDARLSIQVFASSETPGVLRAVGDLSVAGAISNPGLAAESTIKSLECWVFSGNLLDNSAYKSVTINDGDPMRIDDIRASVGQRTLVVAANANIGEVTTLSALREKVMNLNQDISNGMIMVSEATTIGLVEGDNVYGESQAGANVISSVPLKIYRINARVALVSLDYDFSVEMAGANRFNSFELAEVAMFNVSEHSVVLPHATGVFNNAGIDIAGRLFVTAPQKQDFLYGAAWPKASGWGAYIQSGSVVGSLLEGYDANGAVLTAGTLVAPENAHYFYVFENDGVSQGVTTENNNPTGGTLFVLKGKLLKDGVPFDDTGDLPGQGITDGDGFTYYTIMVNADRTNYTYTGDGVRGDGNIKRNTQYNLTVNLTHAGSNVVGLLDEANLDVIVEVAPWLVVNQNIIF